MPRDTDKQIVYVVFKRKEVSLEWGGNRCSGVESEKGDFKDGGIYSCCNTVSHKVGFILMKVSAPRSKNSFSAYTANLIKQHPSTHSSICFLSCTQDGGGRGGVWGGYPSHHKAEVV